MLSNKEISKFVTICFLVLSCADAAGVFFHEPFGFILMQSAVIAVLCIIGVCAIARLLERVKDIREASERTAAEIPEKYEEGELGRLASSISRSRMQLLEAENRQRREKEFLRDIISDISHQIKTPVASLTIFNDLLMKHITDEDSREMLRQSEMQLERIRWLIQSMLQLARIEAESVTFDCKPVDIKALVMSCIDMLQHRANEKGLRFYVEGEKISVSLDREWFREALMNIMKNAVDYAPDNSQIDIIISQTPIATKLEVKDYGVGIREEERLNIFKRFYRVSGQLVNPSNIGIGLALTKSIVEGCGGKIWVESRHVSECLPDEKSYTNMIIVI